MREIKDELEYIDILITNLKNVKRMNRSLNTVDEVQKMINDTEKHIYENKILEIRRRLEIVEWRIDNDEK